MEIGSIVEGRTLYPHSPIPLNVSEFRGKGLGEHLLAAVQRHLDLNGDGDWLVNGSLRAVGKSNVFGREACTFGEVEPRVRQVARILHQEFGVVQGDAVHFVMPGNTEMFIPVIGVWLLHGIVSAGDPDLSEEVIVIQLTEIVAKVVFCCSDTLDKVRRAVEITGRKIPVIVMDKAEGLKEFEHSLEALTARDNQGCFDGDLPITTFHENEVIMIGWSSGTTGRPKGIQTGSNLFYQIIHAGEQLKLTSILQTTCFFHIGGFFGPLISLIIGFQTFFIPPEDLDNDICLIMRVAERCEASSIVCGSHHLIQLASSDMPQGQDPVSTMRILIPVGTNVYDGIFADLKGKFPCAIGVVNLYGQTEGGLVAKSMDQKYLGGVICEAVRIVDPETGEALGPGEVGEITYKTNCPMIGYLNNQEENDKFFGSDGFLHSGDLGHYDDKGTLYYDGRLKELIKYKSFHLYPNELEEMLLRHEDVQDAAVFGKPEPSVQELVTALVVQKPGSNVLAEELQKLVNEQVDERKQLRGGVHFVQKIPRNPQGKILRKKLIDLV